MLYHILALGDVTSESGVRHLRKHLPAFKKWKDIAFTVINGENACECRKSFWRANGKALAMGETEGMLKLFVSSESGLILGCHAYGAHAADIVQEVSALMCKQTTLSELADMVHIHPTLSEILRSAAEV